MNKLQWNLNRNATISTWENVFENIICKNGGHFVLASVCKYVPFCLLVFPSNLIPSCSSSLATSLTSTDSLWAFTISCIKSCRLCKQPTSISVKKRERLVDSIYCQLDCLSASLFQHKTTKPSKLRITGHLFVMGSTAMTAMTSAFPTQKSVM